MSRMVRGSDLVDATPNVTGEIWPTVDDLADYIMSNGQFALDVPGTLPRSVSAALQDVISVTWFGAVGDGVANDAAAAVAAEAYAGANGVVFFPNGSYNLTASAGALPALLRILAKARVDGFVLA